MRTKNEEKLSRIFEYITKYQQQNGKSPTYRDIQKSCEIQSLSSVSLYVKELVKRKKIEIDEHNPWNSIKTPEYYTLSKNHTAFILSTVRDVPFPEEERDDVEACVALPDEIFGDHFHVILHAEGNSMIETGIYDGDLLVVRRTSDAKNGQSVIALLEDGKAICRVYKTGENGSYLEAASSKQSAEAVDHDVLPAGKWTIYGIVDFVIHAPV